MHVLWKRMRTQCIPPHKKTNCAVISWELNIIETLSLSDPAVSLRWSVYFCHLFFFLSCSVLPPLIIVHSSLPLLLSFSRSRLSVVSGASVPPSFTRRLACLPPLINGFSFVCQVQDSSGSNCERMVGREHEESFFLIFSSFWCYFHQEVHEKLHTPSIRVRRTVAEYITCLKHNNHCNNDPII